MGRNKELISQIKDLKHEIMNKDLQLANKDLQLENVKQNEKQTIEMCQLKLQLMEMKHNLINK